MSTRTITVTRICPWCKKQSRLDNVNEERFLRWKRGDNNIQDIFPDLTDAQRETLLTGTHEQCWDEMFADLPDEY